MRLFSNPCDVLAWVTPSRCACFKPCSLLLLNTYLDFLDWLWTGPATLHLSDDDWGVDGTSQCPNYALLVPTRCPVLQSCLHRGCSQLPSPSSPSYCSLRVSKERMERYRNRGISRKLQKNPIRSKRRFIRKHREHPQKIACKLLEHCESLKVVLEKFLENRTFLESTRWIPRKYQDF